MSTSGGVDNSGIIGSLAETFGAPEPALRLLLSILLGYPFAFIHRKLLLGQSSNLQHLYFVGCGLFLGYFNYGFDILHSVACVIIMYGILITIGGSLLSVVVSFSYLMGYLIYSYYSTGTDDYDIKWSMPHCVLTLRLIGLAFDVYDGQKDQVTLPADQKKTALTKCPSILEVAGHTYFFGGFMVGPQFPMKRYIDFTEGHLPAKKIDGKPSCIQASLFRLGLGMLVLSIYQIGNIFLPERSLLSDEFMNFALWKKLMLVAFWGKLCLYKYIACWLISEGSCILTGMTYNGKDSEGNEQWNGCANVKFWEYSVTTSFGGIIKAFNINTNLWVAQYVFKRLRFLGNRLISQSAALLFLALWHGLHSGYYVCFFTEFTVMWMEKDFEATLERFPGVKRVITSGALRIPLFIVMKIYVDIFMGYCLLPFAFLSWDRYSQVYGSIYFIGHILFLGWPLLSLLIRMLFPRSKKKEDATKSQ